MTYDERILLQHYWNDEQLPMSEIARKLHRNQSSISVELHKGCENDLIGIPDSVIRKKLHGFLKYSANLGQHRKLEAYSHRTGARKLNYDWKRKVERYLNHRGYSPEDFVQAFPDCPMSAPTIRNYINKGYIGVSKSAYGRRSSKHKPTPTSKNEPVKTRVTRVKRLDEQIEELNQDSQFKNGQFDDKDKSQQKSSVLKRVSIDERPKAVNNLRYFGHWEMDLVIARDNTRFAVMVFVERKTRYLVALRLGTSRKAIDLIAKFDEFMAMYGQFVDSITMDNDIEFVSHGNS